MTVRRRSPATKGMLIIVVVAGLGILLTWDLISEAIRPPAGMHDGGSPPPGDMASAGPAPLDREIVLEGERVFGTQCAHCHGPQGDWPMAARLKDRSRDQFYVLLDRLPTLNPVMPGFEGSDGERRALAEYLVSLKDGATVP